MLSGIFYRVLVLWNGEANLKGIEFILDRLGSLTCILIGIKIGGKWLSKQMLPFLVHTFYFVQIFLEYFVCLCYSCYSFFFN